MAYTVALLESAALTPLARIEAEWRFRVLLEAKLGAHVETAMQAYQDFSQGIADPDFRRDWRLAKWWAEAFEEATTAGLDRLNAPADARFDVRIIRA